MKKDNISLIALIILLFIVPSICHASGNKEQYIILGWMVGPFAWAFNLIFWWLFYNVRGWNVPSVSIFIVSIICVVLFGITYIGDGAIVPTWFMFTDHHNIGFGGIITNALVIALNALVFIRTRKEKLPEDL